MNERLPISINNPIRSYPFDYKRFTYPWHLHPEFEIIFIEEGEGLRFVADSIEPFGKGDVVFLGTNTPHYLKSDEKYDKELTEERIKGVVIQFEREFMEHSILNYNHLTSIKLLLEESRRGIYFPFNKKDKLVPMIEKIPTKYGVNQLTSLLLLLDKMSKIKTRRLLGSPHFFDTHSFSTDNRIEKVVSYINYHYTEQLTLTSLAAKAAMNSTAFCRYFKEKTGKTLVEYIQHLRVGYACKLLIAGKMHIAQISMECGFNTMSNFNRTFKRITGYTPSDYRERIL